MKRVAIWAAVSSRPQAKKISNKDQIDTGHAHAARHGARVVAELIVPGKSRNIVLFEDACEEIEAYRDLKALIAAKTIDVLIYLDPSRLGRTAALVLTVAELCTRAGILLYETDNPPATMEFAMPDYDALLMRAIKATTAQNEIRKTSDKHKKGMIGRVMEGLFPGRPNYGYVEIFNVAGELERYDIEPKKIATVQTIIELYLEKGWGQRIIADYLNRGDYEAAPYGGQWSNESINFVLHRIWRYAGVGELNRRNPSGRPYIRAKGQWPAVIDEETARRVDAELASRDRSPKSVSNTYRFSRIVSCAICGSPMSIMAIHNKYRRKKDGIIVERKKVYSRCPGGHSRIAERHIHAALTEQIKWLHERAHREELIVATDANATTAAISEIERNQAQIDRAQAGIKRADDDYYIHERLDMDRYHAIVSTANKTMLAAQAEITRLQDKLHEMEQASNLEQRLDEIQEHGLAHLNNPDVKAANAWLVAHFKIWVTFSEITDIEIF